MMQPGKQFEASFTRFLMVIALTIIFLFVTAYFTK